MDFFVCRYTRSSWIYPCWRSDPNFYIKIGVVCRENLEKRDRQRSKKAFALEAGELYSTSLLKSSLKIEFTKEEAASIHQPHNDALMVALTIANIKVYHILVDVNSSVNMLSLTTFDAMKLGSWSNMCLWSSSKVNSSSSKKALSS